MIHRKSHFDYDSSDFAFSCTQKITLHAFNCVCRILDLVLSCSRFRHVIILMSYVLMKKIAEKSLKREKNAILEMKQ